MPSSANKHVFLIGPRGCGKSTVGQQLAVRLGWNWVDLDQLIQEEAGQSIAEIFAHQGQAVFRDLESAALQRQSLLPPQVISLGGGAVLRKENQEIVHHSGYAVFLIASVETLVQRISDDPASAGLRPPLTGNTPSASDPSLDAGRLRDEVQQVLALRMPTYQQTSDLQLDTTHLPPELVVEQIVRWLPRVDRQFADLVTEGRPL